MSRMKSHLRLGMLATMNPSIRLAAISILAMSVAACSSMTHSVRVEPAAGSGPAPRSAVSEQIGRASCRERVLFEV